MKVSLCQLFFLLKLQVCHLYFSEGERKHEFTFTVGNGQSYLEKKEFGLH